MERTLWRCALTFLAWSLIVGCSLSPSKKPHSRKAGARTSAEGELNPKNSPASNQGPAASKNASENPGIERPLELMLSSAKLAQLPQDQLRYIATFGDEKQEGALAKSEDGYIFTLKAWTARAETAEIQILAQDTPRFRMQFKVSQLKDKSSVKVKDCALTPVNWQGDADQYSCRWKI